MAGDQSRSHTIGAHPRAAAQERQHPAPRSATLPHSSPAPTNGLPDDGARPCAQCGGPTRGQSALIALDIYWHIGCFRCAYCRAPLHGEYVAKDGRAYCERDYHKLFGVTCVHCGRYITGKVLQAGEERHYHPSCARCSKCGDPFVPGEEMYLHGSVTWHPRCGPGPGDAGHPQPNRLQPRTRSPSLSNWSRSRSASPFNFISRQFARASPVYTDGEPVGDLSRIYTISYLNADHTQGYLRRPMEPPNPPKSPQFLRPMSTSRLASDRSRCSSRSSQCYWRGRSAPRGMYSVLSTMRSGSSSRARSPSMMNEEAIQLAQYPSGQRPSPDTVPKIERDDFPAPPFAYAGPIGRRLGRSASVATDLDLNEMSANNNNSSSSNNDNNNRQKGTTDSEESPVQQQYKHHQRSSRSISRNDSSFNEDPQLRKEAEELAKIANGIGKVFLQTLKERKKLRVQRRTNLDPRNASRTPSATRELASRLRYDNPTNASPSRDLDRPRPWEDDELIGGEQSPGRARSLLGRPNQLSAPNSYGYKVIQSNRSTPKSGYGLSNGPAHAHVDANINGSGAGAGLSDMPFTDRQWPARMRAVDLLATGKTDLSLQPESGKKATTMIPSTRSLAHAAHFGRSMPNIANLHHLHQDGPPKLYPYHLLATLNYRLPPDVDRCHLERHLSNEEFQYIFHCDRIEFYRLPEWKRNELKRRAKLF